MFGVNPWKLMLWMGHKRIDETMLYVQFAEVHMRPVPESILAAGAKTTIPIGGSASRGSAGGRAAATMPTAAWARSSPSTPNSGRISAPPKPSTTRSAT